MELMMGEALESLSKLIEVLFIAVGAFAKLLCHDFILFQTGHADTVDFAFIDADKGNYCNYIQLCHRLLKPGGLLALDNTLFRASLINDVVTFVK